MNAPSLEDTPIPLVYTRSSAFTICLDDALKEIRDAISVYRCRVG